MARSASNLQRHGFCRAVGTGGFQKASSLLLQYDFAIELAVSFITGH